MTTSEIKPGTLKRVDTDEIPNGSYPGRWGGYIVRFEIGGNTYTATTEIGIRTINAPCVVNILEGKITVQTR